MGFFLHLFRLSSKYLFVNSAKMKPIPFPDDMMAHFYSEYLSLFIALIIAGVAIKLAVQQPDGRLYEFNGRFYPRQKVHAAATLLLLGVVLQIVSDTVKFLDEKQLLLDEKIIAAYAASILVMAFRK